MYTSTPRIYVASLSDYNAGRLHGVWLDADQDPENLSAAIGKMLASSREPFAEEFAIHDYDEFCGIKLSEYESLETVSAIAHYVVEHGEAFAGWAEHVGISTNDGELNRDDLDLFDEHYEGFYDSASDYARYLGEELGIEKELEEHDSFIWRTYVNVDYDQWGHDLEIEMHFYEVGDGVHVFSPL